MLRMGRRRKACEDVKGEERSSDNGRADPHNAVSFARYQQRNGQRRASPLGREWQFFVARQRHPRCSVSVARERGASHRTPQQPGQDAAGRRTEPAVWECRDPRRVFAHSQ